MATTIDPAKPVLVTGATSYVAGWLIKQLLEEGMTVHAAVRHPDRQEKIQHLSALAADNPGTLEFFKTDLLESGSYAEAMEGCELVFHTASPFIMDVKDPRKELVEPAVEGTRNVLEQANKTGSVKRVVLTSSLAAIYCDCSDLDEKANGMFTEDDWNTRSSVDYRPYPYSKTEAEKEGWRIAGEQDRWDLVVINPSLVMGPPLNPHGATSESMNMLKQLGDGTMKMGVPNLGIGIVDVRDVATAHYLAGFKPEAHGRYITNGHNTSLLEVAQTLHKHFGDRFPVPNSASPKWLLKLIGPMINKALTRDFINKNVNRPWRADNSKIRNELGMSFRSLEETMKEAFQVLVDESLLRAKK